MPCGKKHKGNMPMKEKDMPMKGYGKAPMKDSGKKKPKK